MELLKAVGTVTAVSVIMKQRAPFDEDFNKQVEEATTTAVKSMLGWEKVMRMLERTIEGPGDSEGWIQRNHSRTQCINIIKECMKEVTDEDG